MSDARDSAREAWERNLANSLKKAPERKPEFNTTSGIPVKRVYGEEQRGDWDPEQDLGYPGQYPFTRGVQPTMYRSRFWTMRQYSGFGSAEATNRRFRYLL